jgi:hypothetical protein
MGDIIATQLGDDGAVFGKGRLLSWNLKEHPEILGTSSGELPVSPVSPDFPRALEIGCCDGGWCFRLKKKYPVSVVEGVDDDHHWSRVYKGLVLK